MVAPIKTSVTSDRQKYVDEPVYVTLIPKPQFRSGVARAVAYAVDGTITPVIRDVVGHNRVRLRWVKPDGKGGVMPR